MKVGYQHFYNLIFISGCDYYLRTAMENIHTVGIQPRYNITYGILRRHIAFTVIWFPLLYMKTVFRYFVTTAKMYSYIIETFQRADTRCTYSYGCGTMTKKIFKSRTVYRYIFRMHVMTFYLIALYRLESSGTHMQRYLIALNSTVVQ